MARDSELNNIFVLHTELCMNYVSFLYKYRECVPHWIDFHTSIHARFLRQILLRSIRLKKVVQEKNLRKKHIKRASFSCKSTCIQVSPASLFSVCLLKSLRLVYRKVARRRFLVHNERSPTSSISCRIATGTTDWCDDLNCDLTQTVLQTDVMCV